LFILYICDYLNTAPGNTYTGTEHNIKFILYLTFLSLMKYNKIGNEGLICSLRRGMGDKTKATVLWLMSDFSSLQLT